MVLACKLPGMQADMNKGGASWQGARRLHRRLLQSESEGGGSGTSAGCFPDFYTPQDFDDWLQGNYQGVPACAQLHRHQFMFVDVRCTVHCSSAGLGGAASWRAQRIMGMRA